MNLETDTARHPGGRRPLSLDRAVDRFDGELLAGCTKVSRADYFRKLAPLCDLLTDATVLDVTEDDCRAHLDHWRDRASEDHAALGQRAQELLRLAVRDRRDSA